MTTPEELEETIEAGVGTLEPYAAALRERAGETLLPTDVPADAGLTPAGARTMAVVGNLARITAAGDGVRYALGEVIGEGGMGLIRTATQTSLGRQVAVKTLREDPCAMTEAATVATGPHGADPTSLKLLHEAWVTGSLEHPNIVPVYDVALAADGRPLIVLKRIEGVTWSELIADAKAVRERFGAKDLLDWNLRILMTVCNAVSFAHSRGIIHRDLKPTNVMVGAFGEVYVLDWGIALSLRDDADGRLPLASHAHELAGTPLYMAPEMLGASGKRALSERTDVYLLGAILHEVITGRPPHASSSIEAFVSSVTDFRPSFPGEARAELVAICRRAMATEPDERFASVEALRLAIQDFLQFRGSALVAEQAARSLEELEALLVTAPRSSTSAASVDGASLRRDVYNLYGECRFGFQASLRAWPENKVALAGLRRAQIAMIEYETRGRDLKAAATLLAQLDDPPPALRESVRRLESDTEAARREAQKLLKLGRELDLRAGHRVRTWLILLVGIGFTITPLLRDGTIVPTTQAGRVKMIVWPVVFLVVTVALGLLYRRSFMKTAINRRFWGGAVLALAAQVAVHLSGMLLELPIHVVHVMLFGLWFCVSAMMAIALNPRLVLGATAYLAGFFIAARWPELRFYAMSGANFLMMINATALWLSHRARPPTASRTKIPA